MADLADKGVFTEQMPTPPPFWQQFTTANISSLKDIDQDGEEIPQDLRALVPPPPPMDGKYRSFGGNYNIYESLPSLEEQGQERLYPESPKSEAEGEDARTKSDWTIDRTFHLQKVVRSILLNFLELIGNLSQDATQADPKLNDIENLFVNAFQILNEYRPHQARETLILMMEKQVEQRKSEIEAVRKMQEQISSLTTVKADQNGDLTLSVTNGVVTNGVHKADSDDWDDLAVG